MAEEKKLVPLSGITADPKAQPRDRLNQDVVAEYAEALAEGASFPPLIVFFDGSVYWLADGFHRFHAAQEAKCSHFPCDVREGGLRDAVLFSVGANATHGYRRTNEDKRRSVLKLLEDPEWSKWSDSEVARHCKVDHKTVAKLRPDLTWEIPSERAYTTKHGTPAVMDTSRIGRSAAPPEMDETPEELPNQAGQEPAGNVVPIGSRLKPVTPEFELEREAEIADDAERDRETEEYDPSKVEDRALVINGALNTFDFVPITGAEYWSIYGKSPKRETFYKWVLKAKQAIDDIIKEHENALHHATAAEGGSFQRRNP